MPMGALFCLAKHSLRRVYALCASCSVLGKKKWRNYLEEMNYFSFSFCSDIFDLENFLSKNKKKKCLKRKGIFFHAGQIKSFSQSEKIVFSKKQTN